MEIIPGVVSRFCAVKLLDEYVEFCGLLGWDMSRGYLFVQGIKSKYENAAAKCLARGVDHMDQKMAGARFVARLTALGIRCRETLHGNRAGQAIAQVCEGATIREVMAQCLWKSPAMARHYLQLYKILVMASLTDQSKIESEVNGMGLSWNEYKNLNVESASPEVSSFMKAWGGDGRCINSKSLMDSDGVNSGGVPFRFRRDGGNAF